ncbi:probable cytochrome P450 28a5 [Uranotaenia lowii]|uniref:probable cytochrome P450 28a5 n=1 Tax=Uranotaenia lowii TaxID=190385 RepID=UPI00247A7724|nr:probable cytochrome P450 28a5 [Uranotaenia lowii]
MLLIIISLILIALGILYLYLVWNFGYWKKRNVPGPDPLPFLGNFPAFILRNHPLVEDFDKIYREYKSKFNFVGVFSQRAPRILITSPELGRDILSKHFKHFHDNEFGNITDKESDPLFGRNPFFLEGEEWKQMRAEITPAFTSSRMKALYSLVEDVAARMTTYVKKNRGTTLETKELAAKFTTDVVSNCIFAADAQSFTNDKAEIREQGRKLMDNSFWFIFAMMTKAASPALARLLNLSLIKKDIEQFFTNLMKQAIQVRESSSVKRADYLDYLIGLKNKKEISEIDMAAHGVTFFIDGFETSSVALSFTLYELAKNPDVQKRLREELVKAIADDGSISYEAIQDLPYLDQVISETLRLWPPGAWISKKCTIPIELELKPNEPVLIEKDVCAMISIWSIQRDPEYFENPLKFDPDRFSPENGGINPYREKGCYIPFGEGPRQCLGMRFARMQVKRGIFEIIKNFEITVNPKTRDPLSLDPKEFLTMALGGVWLDFEPIE